MEWKIKVQIPVNIFVGKTDGIIVMDNLTAMLDMLRYAGLLTEVMDFHFVYMAKNDPGKDVERWRSMGWDAEVV